MVLVDCGAIYVPIMKSASLVNFSMMTHKMLPGTFEHFLKVKLDTSWNWRVAAELTYWVDIKLSGLWIWKYLNKSASEQSLSKKRLVLTYHWALFGLYLLFLSKDLWYFSSILHQSLHFFHRECCFGCLFIVIFTHWCTKVWICN